VPGCSDVTTAVTSRPGAHARAGERGKSGKIKRSAAQICRAVRISHTSNARTERAVVIPAAESVYRWITGALALRRTVAAMIR